MKIKYEFEIKKENYHGDCPCPGCPLYIYNYDVTRNYCAVDWLYAPYEYPIDIRPCPIEVKE